jgi:hypothetical protein
MPAPLDGVDRADTQPSLPCLAQGADIPAYYTDHRYVDSGASERTACMLAEPIGHVGIFPVSCRYVSGSRSEAGWCWLGIDTSVCRYAELEVYDAYAGYTVLSPEAKHHTFRRRVRGNATAPGAASLT